MFIGNSLVDWSEDVIRSLSNMCSRIWNAIGEHVRTFALLIVLPGLLLTAYTAVAQEKVTNYRQSILSIQQEIESGNLEGARALILSTAKNYPGNGGLDNLLGIIEIQQGNVNAARRAFSAAIRHDPRLVGAYLNLSRIDLQTASNDPVARTEALRLSERVLQLEPTNDEAQYQVATVLGWEKNYQQSLDHLQKLSPLARAEVGAEALLCADQAALGNRDATDRAASALAANPDMTEQDATLCLPALRAAHRADLIETIFTAIANRHPLSASGLRILGLAQEAEGKFQLARATLESAFVLDAKSATVLVDLTRIAEAVNDHEGALGYLAHARELQPTDASLPYEFGVICLKMGLYGESRKAIAEALKLDPGNPEYNLGMGTVVSFSEDPSQALPYLEKYRSLRPKDPAVFIALGTTYFRAKDYDTATIWLKKALSTTATSSDAHFYLGRIARQEGHLDSASAELKRSLALRPDQPDALAELGQISVITHDYPQAATYLNRAIQLDSDNYAGNFGLLQLYARTGDPRREQQSERFDEIKNKKEEHDRDMMRVLEIRRSAGSDRPD